MLRTLFGEFAQQDELLYKQFEYSVRECMCSTCNNKLRSIKGYFLCITEEDKTKDIQQLLSTNTEKLLECSKCEQKANALLTLPKFLIVDCGACIPVQNLKVNYNITLQNCTYELVGMAVQTSIYSLSFAKSENGNWFEYNDSSKKQAVQEEGEYVPFNRKYLTAALFFSKVEGHDVPANTVKQHDIVEQSFRQKLLDCYSRLAAEIKTNGETITQLQALMATAVTKQQNMEQDLSQLLELLKQV